MPPSSPAFDAVVIGGGHNGLVCAGVLAKRGLRTLVLEAADEVGGAARTVEIAPGFKVSGLAHIASHLHPEVIEALGLHIEMAASDIATMALDAGGRHLELRRGTVRGLEGDFEPGDQAAWSRLYEKLVRFAGILKPFLARTPPRLDFTLSRDALTLGRLGLAVRRLGREDMREFLRMILMNIADVLDDELDDGRLKGAIAFDAVLGTHLGPRSPGSLLSYYYRLAGESGGVPAALSLPKGGMGAVAQALAEAARSAGAEIRTGAPVSRIEVENDSVTGVALASGEEIRARRVVSAANPRTTLFDLLGARHLDTGMARRLKNVRMRGNVAKLSLALDGLPAFTGLDESHLSGRLVIAPSMDALEEAFNPAKYGAFSRTPAMEIVIPSLTDPALAPPGKHVLSANVIYAPYALRDGWESARAVFLEAVIGTLDTYAPGIHRLVLASELLTPADIERIYRMPGGHWHHGELAVDQMFMLRPVPFAAQYDTPVKGLYLAGAGCHPGGNVMGAAGLNAARRILEAESGR